MELTREQIPADLMEFFERSEGCQECYVCRMVAVFREVRRVLRDDGTLWLNLGDSYNSGPAGNVKPSSTGKVNYYRGPGIDGKMQRLVDGLKPKDLVGIPWRVAFALQADGWYLRSDIIWSKPNPMPESVTDRPTKSHEYLFLLTKSPRYFFDADAVREADSGYASGNGFVGRQGGTRATVVDGGSGSSERFVPGAGRNIRSVWSIATQPYPGAHFATFPPKLVEPCILAGTSERGVCPDCGTPWERMTKKVGDAPQFDRYGRPIKRMTQDHWKKDGDNRHRVSTSEGVPVALGSSVYETVGWRPTCAHTGDPVPATVMDIFGGSGTTAMVAQHLNRRAVLIELNPDYIDQALRRNAAVPMGLTA